ncbi:MAG: 1,4-alpha-glucan branching enzyme [Solirubrobacteraceae bacterium]|nr:1,4-alpha-glucan branching enzyme [Solirubrobacteraceae bacterium]
MPLTQAHISAATPMGAAVESGGATFRIWAPAAEHVHVLLDGAGEQDATAENELVKDPASGHWTGFVAGAGDGTTYRFFVAGPGGSGLKRDPRARELVQRDPGWDAIVRDPAPYPWHDEDFEAPAREDLVVYQLHIGRFFARGSRGEDLRRHRVAKFLDALDRVEYLSDLGVNAVQPLPVVEFAGEWSLGYNGTDIFSPETDYSVPAADLAPYVVKVNALLAQKGHEPVTAQQLGGQVNQLKAFVDVCHVYGLAVIVDVVYNHAGGGLDAQSLDYLDFPASPNRTNSLYFSGEEWAGGKVFRFQDPDVRAFLVENATMFLAEYHADGLRFDEVGVIDDKGGWSFCQQLTAALHEASPDATLIAEYWREHRWLAVARAPEGMGFDIGYADGLRDGVRSVLTQAAGGASAAVDIGRLRRGLERPWNVPFAWQAYNCVENHDLVLDQDGDHRHPRIPRLADAGDPRSWYARSRTRVATGLLLTAPGVPMLFMGQEILEDKLWSDDPNRDDTLVWWDGLDGADPHMADFHRFTRAVTSLRRRHPALRAEPIDVYHADDANRVLAFHRWIPGSGRDVVVVVSFGESTFYEHAYRLGLPLGGTWHEVFNSDLYDHFPNPWVQGNGGSVAAGGPPLHGMAQSAGMTIPANSVLVLARDDGDA